MPIGCYENPAIRRLRDERGDGGAEIDHDLATVAELQGGHVHRRQLRDLGLSESAIDRRVARGRLHRTGWMTYAVGHRRDDRLARLHSSLLIAGDGAALSHRAAAGELGLLTTSSAPIEITVPRHRRPPPGARYYRRSLPDDEIVFENGLAVTSVGRTLFDLAGQVGEWRYRRAVREAQVQRLHCWPPLATLLDRHPRSPGAGLIRTILAAGAAPANVVPTDGEDRFLELVSRGGFPAPAQHYGIALADDWVEVDLAWPELGIAVEVDSSFHEVPIAIETDRARDQALLAGGWVVFRCTWRQLYDDPDGVLRRFTKLYASVASQRSSRGPRIPTMA